MVSIVEVNKNCEFCGKRVWDIPFNFNASQRSDGSDIRHGITVCKEQRYHEKCAKKRAEGKI